MEASDLPPAVPVPAVCRHCHLNFPTGIMIAEGGTAVIKGSTAGPCPLCGGRLEIPDGTYELIGGVMHVFRGWTAEKRQDFARAITAARSSPDPRVAVTELLQSEPTLASLAQRLLVPRDAGQFWAFIAVLLSALALATGNAESPVPRDDGGAARSKPVKGVSPTPRHGRAARKHRRRR